MPARALPRVTAVTAVVLGVAASVLVALAGPSAAPADGAPRWAPLSRATITPGVQMVTEGSQCTANFVFTDARDRVYVGYSAHCAGKGAATDTDGCSTASHPIGTPVTFRQGDGLLLSGTTVGRGRLAYSSWTTMRRLGTRNADACAYNDFALVRVAAGDVGKVNPSVPTYGGPTGLATGVADGATVLSYGSSSLRQGSLLSPKRGIALGTTGGGWSHDVLTFTPGIPGDSGSGFLDARGRAFGTLSTLAIAPVPGENGVGNLAKELAFAQRHSGIAGLRLVKGTRAFTG